MLVQGTAEVDDLDLAENRRRYRRESLEKLPGEKDMLPPRFLEGLFSWYFERIYVKVRPERVFVWKGGDFATEPEIHDAHIEEVRSGHVEEPAAPHADPPKVAGPRGRRMDELGTATDGRRLLGCPRRLPVAARLRSASTARRGRSSWVRSRPDFR